MCYQTLRKSAAILICWLFGFATLAHAQKPTDTIEYSEFRFTLLDVQKKELTPATITVRVGDIFLTDSSNGSMQYVTAKVEYSEKDSCWILSQYDPLGYQYELEIFRNSDTVNLRLLELRKMTLLWPGYNMLSQEGCQYCVCYNIPFQKGVFTIDVPKRPESWAFIRKIYINIRSLPIEFRDISAIQNWMINSGK